MPKSKTEKKLLKHAHKFALLEAELQLIYPPKVFAQIEDLCRVYLEQSKYDSPSRERISKLAFTLRQETYTRFRHESLETIILSKLLRKVERGFKPPPPRLDAVSHMRTYHKSARLDTTQEAAADRIKAVWEAFSKFRFIGARGFEGGSHSNQTLHPLDVMGQDLWEHYQKAFKPWYQKAKDISVDRKRYTNGQVTLAGLVFRVLVEDYFPEEIDKGFNLVHGTTYRALKVALTGYFEPEALDHFVEQGKPRAADVPHERSAPPAATAA